MEYHITVECRYKAVQYSITLHTSLQRRGQNINQRLNREKIHHISPYPANYGMSFARILDKIDRVIYSRAYKWQPHTRNYIVMIFACIWGQARHSLVCQHIHDTIAVLLRFFATNFGLSLSSSMEWSLWFAKVWHDDVVKCKHFPHYWHFVWVIHRWPMNSPHKGHHTILCEFISRCSSLNASLARLIEEVSSVIEGNQFKP